MYTTVTGGVSGTKSVLRVANVLRDLAIPSVTPLTSPRQTFLRYVRAELLFHDRGKQS